ncbi:MAG TPA: bifunctional 5,10-methylene-tetrahydrofolate dehydrogenase/5,10-methylene-tetrahydrofolate cyclohydrolase [bacterium]|nr:bifunctional 5,10-methylene-tetrahydrofolate dehydrogenase/5,10-methylene-tetrahydrofolate cyclohydrolase [bacterium]
MAKLIQGKPIAQTIRQEVASETANLKKNGIQPHLTVVLVGENPASQVYVRMKSKACNEAGIESETLILDSGITEEKLLNIIHELNQNPKVHGILVQLPLPDAIHEDRILEAILPSKDVDGFHPVNVGKLMTGMTDGFVPATPSGILELLMRSGYPPQGKHVVVVGRSNIVGKPAGMLLLRKGREGDATVTFCHSRTPDLASVTKRADILIAAIGRPRMITQDMVKPGVVVIDVGVNRVEDPSTEKGYRLEGDVDFDTVSQIAEAITPVPGGVGPMTIACLLQNTIKACKQLNRKES